MDLSVSGDPIHCMFLLFLLWIFVVTALYKIPPYLKGGKQSEYEMIKCWMENVSM